MSSYVTSQVPLLNDGLECITYLVDVLETQLATSMDTYAHTHPNGTEMAARISTYECT